MCCILLNVSIVHRIQPCKGLIREFCSVEIFQLREKKLANVQVFLWIHLKDLIVKLNTMKCEKNYLLTLSEFSFGFCYFLRLYLLKNMFMVGVGHSINSIVQIVTFFTQGHVIFVQFCPFQCVVECKMFHFIGVHRD